MSGDLTGRDREDVAALRRTWNEAYLGAVANQHGLEWLRAAPGSKLVDVHGRRTIQVSGALIENLADVSPAVFSFLRYTCAVERQKFSDRPTARSSRSLAFALSRAFDRQTLADAQLAAGLRVLFAVVAVVAGSPQVDQLDGGPVLWVVFAAFVLVTAPWKELWTWRQIAAPKLDSMLSVGVRT